MFVSLHWQQLQLPLRPAPECVDWKMGSFGANPVILKFGTLSLVRFMKRTRPKVLDGVVGADIEGVRPCACRLKVGMVGELSGVVSSGREMSDDVSSGRGSRGEEARAIVGARTSASQVTRQVRAPQLAVIKLSLPFSTGLK